VDPERLSGPGRDAYRRVSDALNPAHWYADGFLGLGGHLRAAPEFRFRTNAGLPWRPDSESPAFTELELNLFFADSFELTAEPILAMDPTFYDEAGSLWGVNVPYTHNHFDMNMPLRTFAAAGGPWWNLQLGRDQVSFGAGHTGNMALSGTPDYYDFIRAVFFSPDFKYSLLVSQMPLNTSDLLSPLVSPLASGALTSTTQRYLYLHRMDLRLFHRVSLGISEGVMVGNSPLELRYLSPFVFFHSFNAWRDYAKWTGWNTGDMVGSLLSVDIDWAVIPSLAFYGQFVMNELAFAEELLSNNIAPNGLGFLGGLEFTHSFPGWQFLVFGEFVYTDPYLYTLSSPFASYIWMRRLSESAVSKKNRYRWIGHPEGRDTMLFALGASLSRPGLSLTPELSFAVKGNHTILWDWNRGSPYSLERSPSGIPEYRLIPGLQAAWDIFPWLQVSGYIRETLVFDAGHVQGAFEDGFEIGLSAAFTLKK
jgi:hypothetical protein